MYLIVPLYTLWVIVGCVVAVSKARLARYEVDNDKDYNLWGFLSIVSMGPFVHFWLKRKGY